MNLIDEIRNAQISAGEAAVRRNLELLGLAPPTPEMPKKIRHSLLDIVAAGLAAHGYSGLVCPGVCGCRIDDLSPGDCIDFACAPGYQHTHSQRPEDWIISTSQDPVQDEEIDACRP